MKKTPKLAYIISRFPKVTETFVLREILELQRQKSNVYIYPLLNVKENIEHDEYKLISSNVFYTPFISIAIILANIRLLYSRTFKYFEVIQSIIYGYINSPKLLIGALSIFPKCIYLADIMKKKEIDHIHAHFSTYPALSALIISEFSEITFSFTVHAFDIFLSRNMLDQKLNKAEFIISISDYNKKYLLNLYPGLLPQKIKVIHCGIAIEKYSSLISEEQKKSIRNQYNVSNNHFLIISVASLQKHKGINYLIRACSLITNRIPNLRCLVIGEGKERNNHQLLIRQLNLDNNVFLAGSLKQSEVIKLLKVSDLFVLPSIVGEDGRKEGIPVSLMEAMGTGLPVISSDISGISELIDNNINGILTKPGDYKKIAESIEYIYMNPELGKGMGSEGLKKIADEFDLESNVRKINKIFSDSINENKKTSISKSSLKNIVKKSISTKHQLTKNNYSNNEFNLKKIKSGYDSFIYEVCLNKSHKYNDNLILKLYRPTKVPSEEKFIKAQEYANREYNSLLKLYESFSSKSDIYSVPRTIEYYPEIAAVLMEKCPGTRLDKQTKWISIKSDKIKLDRMIRYFKNTGEWLDLFHKITKKEILPDQIYSKIKSEFYIDLDFCKRFGLDINLANRLEKYINGNLHMFSGEHEVVGHHCDFAPYNVFVSERSLSVIDFEGLTDGLIYDDLTYFLAKIESISFYHLDEISRNMLEDSFLKGYFGSKEIDTNNLDYFMIISMVKQMSRNPIYRDNNSGFKSKLGSYRKLKFYNNWFRDKLENIQIY